MLDRRHLVLRLSQETNDPVTGCQRATRRHCFGSPCRPRTYLLQCYSGTSCVGKPRAIVVALLHVPGAAAGSRLAAQAE